MLKNTPQLYYTTEELLQKFERSLQSQIEDVYPIRLMFMVDDLPTVTEHYVDPKDMNMMAVTLTYRPLRIVNKWGEKDLLYVLEGNEKIFHDITEEKRSKSSSN